VLRCHSIFLTQVTNLRHGGQHVGSAVKLLLHDGGEQLGAAEQRRRRGQPVLEPLLLLGQRALVAQQDAAEVLGQARRDSAARGRDERPEALARVLLRLQQACAFAPKNFRTTKISKPCSAGSSEDGRLRIGYELLDVSMRKWLDDP